MDHTFQVGDRVRYVGEDAWPARDVGEIVGFAPPEFLPSAETEPEAAAFVEAMRRGPDGRIRGMAIYTALLGDLEKV